MPSPASRFVLLLFLLSSLWVTAPHAEQPLRLGTNVWPGYEPLYIAAERARWEQSIGVRLIEYPSASEVLRAFRNKALEAAALTLDEVLALGESGLPLRVVAVLDVSSGGDVILGKPGLASLADLKGRRVAVESGALGAYMITRALELHGMTVSDVEVVHRDVSAQEAAYLADEVEAVVTFEPVRTRLIAAGAKELFSSRQIPGEIVDVLVVHDEFLKRQPEQVRRLVADWFDALAFLGDRPREAAEFTARRLKITPEQVLASYQGLYLPDEAANRSMLGGGLAPTLARLQETLLREGLLNRPVALEGLLEPGMLPR